ALLELFRQSATIADADLKALPADTWNPGKPSLGSSLALECARQLTHDGHDDELKAFFTARVAAIEASIRPGHSAGGSVQFVNGIQADACRAFLAELERSTSPRNGQESGIAPPAPLPHAKVRLAPVLL